MDNYILVGSQEEPVPLASAVETPRPYRKLGCIGILFVGCGFLWRSALTAFPKGVDTPRKIAGVYTEADLVTIFGRDGPKPEHILRRHPQMMLSTDSGVGVDSDVNSHDIYQGMLGDCYFDAALAAIAHEHKDSISSMFLHIDMDQNTFQTQWFFGGRWVTVTVNAEIPVNPDTQSPFFLWTSSELTMWPAILEKSYAKLVGNYKGIESGQSAEALQYVLGVPVDQIYDYSGTWSNIRGATDLDDVWNKIVEAVDNHYPMAVGTSRGGYHGIAGGHAYTLYDCDSNYQGHGRSVRVRNPWGHNRYAGDISGQTDTIGDFWITWDEFIQNYVSVSIAKMKPGYQTSGSLGVPVSSQGVSGSKNIQVSHSDTFTVQALWYPSRVATAAHCSAPHVQYWTCGNAHTCPTRLLLYPSGNSASPQVGESTVNGMRVDGQGAGIWTVELVVDGSFSGLPEIALSIYRPGSGDLLLVETLKPPSTLNVSTLGSTKEAPHKAASLQPIETPSCSDYYSRLTNDMNGNVVPSDTNFPESEVSIADVGTDCGDAAHGYRLPCSHFNHWQNMIHVADVQAEDRSCFTFTHQGDACHVANTNCNRNAVFFCHIVGCEMASTLGHGHYFIHANAECCGCNDPHNYR